MWYNTFFKFFVIYILLWSPIHPSVITTDESSLFSWKPLINSAVENSIYIINDQLARSHITQSYLTPVIPSNTFTLPFSELSLDTLYEEDIKIGNGLELQLSLFNTGTKNVQISTIIPPDPQDFYLLWKLDNPLLSSNYFINPSELKTQHDRINDVDIFHKKCPISPQAIPEFPHLEFEGPLEISVSSTPSVLQSLKRTTSNFLDSSLQVDFYLPRLQETNFKTITKIFLEPGVKINISGITEVFSKNSIYFDLLYKKESNNLEIEDKYDMVNYPSIEIIGEKIKFESENKLKLKRLSSNYVKLVNNRENKQEIQNQNEKNKFFIWKNEKIKKFVVEKIYQYFTQNKINFQEKMIFRISNFKLGMINLMVLPMDLKESGKSETKKFISVVFRNSGDIAVRNWKEKQDGKVGKGIGEFKILEVREMEMVQSQKSFTVSENILLTNNGTLPIVYKDMEDILDGIYV